MIGIRCAPGYSHGITNYNIIESIFDASAPSGETEGQFPRQHVGLFPERYTQTSYSSLRTRRLELFISPHGRRRSLLDSTAAQLDWPTARVMRIKDPTTPTYITPAEPQNGSWPRAQRPAATKPRPPGNDQPTSIPQNTPQTGLWGTELVWYARQDALASNRLSYISVSSRASASPTSKKNKRLSNASGRTFLGHGDVLDVNTRKRSRQTTEQRKRESGCCTSVARLLRGSQGVELITHPKRARSPDVHWVHLSTVRMRGIDQNTGGYSRAR